MPQLVVDFTETIPPSLIQTHPIKPIPSQDLSDVTVLANREY